LPNEATFSKLTAPGFRFKREDRMAKNAVFAITPPAAARRACPPGGWYLFDPHFFSDSACQADSWPKNPQTTVRNRISADRLFRACCA
jgi:hypothetical protein